MTTCPTCKEGTLKPAKKYRLSGPAIFIGYIALIPSIIGILVGIGTILLASLVADEFKTADQQSYTQTLKAAGFTDSQINLGGFTDSLDADSLTNEQWHALRTATTQRENNKRSTDIAKAGGITSGVAIIALSLCGGLLGWLLTMKKKVLQCPNCTATIAAS